MPDPVPGLRRPGPARSGSSSRSGREQVMMEQFARDQKVTDYEMVIGGKSAPAAGGAWLSVEDPYTGQEWARVPEADQADVTAAVHAAQAAAQAGWATTLPAQR